MNIIEDSYRVMQNRRNIKNLYDAIAVFQKKKDDYDAWYLKRDRVSLRMISDRDTLIQNCDWAIKELNNEVARLQREENDLNVQ